MSYASLNQSELFSEWRIESQSGNTILFEVELQNVLDALNSAR